MGGGGDEWLRYLERGGDFVLVRGAESMLELIAHAKATAGVLGRASYGGGGGTGKDIVGSRGQDWPDGVEELERDSPRHLASRSLWLAAVTTPTLQLTL